MSKRNRRPDKGQPGSRAAAKAEQARRAAAVAGQQFTPEQAAAQAAAVADTFAVLAQSPQARWRAPYSPAIPDWGDRWCARNDHWSNERLVANADFDDLDWMGYVQASAQDLADEVFDYEVSVQPDAFYDTGTYGMTGVGESMLNALAVEAAEFFHTHARRITVEDTPPGIETLATRVLEVADVLGDWIDPAFVDAYVATGYFITADTRVLFTPAEVAAWDQHVRRWRAAHVAPYRAGMASDIPYPDEPDMLPPSVLHPVLAEMFSAEFARHTEPATT